MKQQTDEKKQSVVSVPVIVIAVIAIGAMVYFLLQPTSSPEPQPDVPNVQTEPVTVIDTSQSDNNASAPTNTQSTTNSTFSKDSVIGFLHGSRDPFKPSALVLKVDAPQKSNQNIEPVVVKPVDSEIPSKETDDINAVLKGIVKTSDKQVAMINFKRKTHLLYVGDRLPDTNYLVADINNNSVLLISPNKRLRLEKKEAK